MIMQMKAPEMGDMNVAAIWIKPLFSILLKIGNDHPGEGYFFLFLALFDDLLLAFSASIT